MQKELEPIQQLEQEKTRLSNMVRQRESLVGKLGTDKVWIGSSSEGGFLDKVVVGSSFENTLKVGRARKTTRDSVVRLNGRLEGVNNQIQELHAEEEARAHLAELNLRRTQLAVMSEMVAEGNLTEDDLRKHQQDFEELQKLPETSPFLKRGIDRIRQEEEREKEKAETAESVEIEELPATYTLPNGKEIRGKRAQLLSLLTNASKDNPIGDDQLVEKIYRGIDYKTAERRLSVLKAEVKREVLTDDTGLVWMDVYGSPTTPEGDTIPVTVRLGSHIVKSEQPVLQSPVESTEDKPSPQEPQSKLSKVDAFIQELPDETRALFAEVRESTDFGYVRDIVRSFVGTNPEDIKELERRVAGYLFETFAYLHLRKNFSEQNQILLSPQETFEIYYQLYPQRRGIYHKYKLQRGIDGISVPDGILLTPLKNGNRGIRVDGVLEYMLGIRDDLEATDKLTRDPSRFLESMSPLKDARSPESNVIRQYLRSRYPDFPRSISVNPNAEAFLAVPLDAKMPTGPLAGVKEISIPVSAVTFGHFVNALMAESVSESPTEPGMFRLPDGKLVPLSEKEQKYLPLIPTNRDEAISNYTIVAVTYKDELERGDIELRTALGRTNALRYGLNERKLNPAGWEIKNAAPRFEIVEGKRRGAGAKLYLTPVEIPKEAPPETPPTIEIGETQTIQPQEPGGGENIEDVLKN